jgi:4'-phosphopantetheinyl transferase
VTPVHWWSAGLAHVPRVDDWIDEVEAARFAAMRFTKRRSEAALSRFCAKTTVAMALGRSTDPASLRSIQIRNARDGAPETQVNGHDGKLVIAMTDRADWAVAAVVEGRSRIGCDLELVEPRSEAFVADYFTSTERSTVARAAEPALTSNLIWSAKESALKVLRTGLRRDTRTVEVTLGQEPADAWRTLEVETTEGRRMWGWWRRYNSFVLTVVGENEIAAPQSLERPPPLATAIPGHSWLDRPRVN